MESEAWKGSKSTFIGSQEAYKENVEKVGSHFKKALTEEISKRAAKEKRNIVVSDTPLNRSVLLEIAFTEMVFGNPGAYTAAVATPLPGTSYVLDSAKSPFASIEGRVTDVQTGKVLAIFADKKFPQIKAFDFNKFTIRSPLNEVVELWTEELSDSMFAKADAKVASTGVVGILPW